MLSKKTKREKTKKVSGFFLEKLFNILKSKEDPKIIDWNEDGTKIIIFDPIKLSSKILPKYFGHQNYSSFVRQLNLYGFNKITNIYNSKSEQYFNKNFQNNKDIKEIKNIKRNNKSNKENENEDIENLPKKKAKKHKKIINENDKEDDDKQKIIKFKKLIQKGKMNDNLNKNILEFLIKKSNEKIEFYQKMCKEIQDINENIKINFLNIKCLNNNLSFDKKSNNINKIKNNNNDFESNNLKNNDIVTIESIESIENPEFVMENKEKEKNEIHLQIPFCNEIISIDSNHDLPKNFDNQKNYDYFQQPQHPSICNYNKTLFVNFNNNNNNNNTNIKKCLTNSFILKYC